MHCGGCAESVASLLNENLPQGDIWLSTTCVHRVFNISLVTCFPPGPANRHICNLNNLLQKRKKNSGCVVSGVDFEVDLKAKRIRVYNSNLSTSDIISILKNGHTISFSTKSLLQEILQIQNVDCTRNCNKTKAKKQYASRLRL